MTVPSSSNDSNISEYRRSFGVINPKFISERRDTVQGIWSALEMSGVILVRGTPCSGKTTLGYLVAKYTRDALKEPYQTVYISQWRRKSDEHADDILRNACTMKSSIDEIFQSRILFVIDEAQTTYSDSELWNTHLKASSGGKTVAKFLLLACHGSSSKWKEEVRTVTPMIAGPEQQIFLRASSSPGYLPLSIYYKPDELDDAVRKYERERNAHYRLTPAARKSLLDVSYGHAGLVDSLLDVVYNALEPSFREESTTEITAEAFEQYISDTQRLLWKLRSRVVGRSLVGSQDDQPFPTELRDLVKRILETGPVIYDSMDNNHAFLYHNGICQGHIERVRYVQSKPHVIIEAVEMTSDSVAAVTARVVGQDAFGESIWEADRTVLVFPTGIHAR